ncbi:MAG: alpha/beta hydrolase [Bdellovibrionales bacterium]|nr:alpha/beta hydrolase [Bdellovibrionales bacterium]
MLTDYHPGHFITPDQTRICYQTNFIPEKIDPNKKLLVFNYGLVCSQFQWSYQIPFFEKHNYQILLHDYRCHFESSCNLDINTCTYENILSDMAQLFDQFDTNNIYLLGHSMGVNISLECAKQFPKKIKGLILISGTAFPPNDTMFDSKIFNVLMPFIEKQAKTFPKIHSFLLKNAYKSKIITTMVQRGGFHPTESKEDFVRVYLKKIGELNPYLFFQLYNEMQNHAIINVLERIKAKTLIIGGDRDNIIPNYLQFIFKEFIKNSEIYILNEGSHVPQADFPDKINERIKLFLDGIR